MTVRVRYAPSPTGSPHVGNIRDALFKHLLAKHHKGVNILRIEDTDRTRYIEGAERDIMESLHWMGIQWTEGPDVGGPHGPYRQSERKEAGIYAHWINVLLERGLAYKAFDTSQELEEMREYQQINKQPVGYFGGVWRDATPEAVEKAEKEGKPFVIRQRIPRNETVVIHDFIRGRIEWDTNTVDDPVLIKADGMPTYHFAAMVDDHLMEITHIIRGEEWISSAPKHALLFDAFGWERPVFVHCPVIKGKDGKKLSKRHGDTRCLDYRAAGYMPEALANFIALIGWSPGEDREILSMDELAEAFDLGGLQPSPGVFDIDKLRWMNGNYIRALSPEALTATVKQYLTVPDIEEYFTRIPEGADAPIDAAMPAAVALMREAFEKTPELAATALLLEQPRVTTLSEFATACMFFFQEEPPFDEKAVEKWFGQPHVGPMIEHFQKWSSGLQAATLEDCEKAVRDYAEANSFDKMGPVVHPIRVALTGKTVGPGLFELMSALGPQVMAKRFQRALGRIAKANV
ncbi:MAG: glutamate--tRNA ligase [Armatimonadetes bacterium]|nr:glutamate--tRNA ligase [Armatimonadota bacterium]